MKHRTWVLFLFSVALSLVLGVTSIRLGLPAAGSASVVERCTPTLPIVPPVINQGFGNVPDPSKLGQTHYHSGLDFDGRIGDPVVSPVCGTVIYASRETNTNSYNWGYGWHIKIQDNQGLVYLLAHVSKIYVRPGDVVTSGQLIAEVGNNGNSSAPHCHIEIRRNNSSIQTEAELKKVVIDPRLLLKGLR